MILCFSNDCVGFSDVSGSSTSTSIQTEPQYGGEMDCCRLRTRGTSTTRLVAGVISAMVEKELWERNFGFDSLKSRLNRDMEEKGIVARDCLLLGSLEAAPPPELRHPTANNRCNNHGTAGALPPGLCCWGTVAGAQSGLPRVKAKVPFPQYLLNHG